MPDDDIKALLGYAPSRRPRTGDNRPRPPDRAPNPTARPTAPPPEPTVQAPPPPAPAAAAEDRTRVSGVYVTFSDWYHRDSRICVDVSGEDGAFLTVCAETRDLEARMATLTPGVRLRLRGRLRPKEHPEPGGPTTELIIDSFAFADLEDEQLPSPPEEPFVWTGRWPRRNWHTEPCGGPDAVRGNPELVARARRAERWWKHRVLGLPDTSKAPEENITAAEAAATIQAMPWGRLPIEDRLPRHWRKRDDGSR